MSMYESNVFSSGGPLLRSETCGNIRIPNNVVQVGPTSDPRAALAQLPTDGGIISLAPGEYWNFGLGTNDHNCIAIVGETGSDGARPIIHGSIFGSNRTGQVIYIANIEVNGDRTINTGINLARHHRQELYPCLMVIDNVYLHDFTGNGIWPSGVSFLELHNTELARNGAGNHTHNIYVGDETSAVVIRGGHYHSAKGSHPFKSKARRLLAVGATFETTNRWQEYLENPEFAQYDPFFGTTLLDSVGNAQHHIVDCTFNFFRRKGTGDFMFEMQRRKGGRNGCDDPFYEVRSDLRTYLPPQEQVQIADDLGRTYPEPDRASEFWDNGWWQAARNARPKGDLRSRIWRCRFNVIARDQPRAVINAVSNLGTLPIVNAGATRTYDYPIPSAWWDRAVVLVAPSCTYANMPEQDIFRTGINNTRPLIPDARREDPLINPRVFLLSPDDAREENWRDIVPKFNEFSRWRYQAEADRNLAIMRERLVL